MAETRGLKFYVLIGDIIGTNAVLHIRQTLERHDGKYLLRLRTQALVS